MSTAKTELLVRLIARHQDELFRYILTLLPNEEDARDTLQETYIALYRKFDEYDRHKPFVAWAYGFAFLEVLKQRERNQRGTRLLSRELVDHLARERPQHEAVLQARLAALAHCLDQLTPADRELIRRRYQGKSTMDKLVTELGSSRRTLFRQLDRIRRLLFECINRRVATEP